MEKKNVNFSINAPYYKLGAMNQSTRKVWMVLHGYGQLADEFARVFVSLATDDTCMIFPQGLSNFYLKGVEDKIGASWMTKHDRELQIENYCHYLNHIFEQEIKSYHQKVDFNVLGFSQGGHTASRWIYRSNIKYNKLILWGTELAHEIDHKLVSEHFAKGKNIVVVGDQDKFVSTEQLHKVKSRYAKIGLRYQLLEYHGGHIIDPEILREIF